MKGFKKALQEARQQPVIVEGKKDKQALENLGFEKVFKIHQNNKSIYERIEEITEKADGEVCILTDLDKEGKKLYFLLKRELGKKKAKLNNTFRAALLKWGISHVEGLDKFVENVKREIRRKDK